MMAPLAPPVFASPGLGPPQMDGDRDREQHRREHRHRQPAKYDKELSRRLSKFLRHPDHAIRDERLKVGEDNWAELPAVLERLNLKINGEPVPSPVDRAMIMEVVRFSRNREEDDRFEYKSEADQEFVRAKYKVSLHQRRTTGEPRATAATSASTTPPAPTTPPPPPTMWPPAAHDDDADASQEAASQEETIAELKWRVENAETRNAFLHGQLDKVLLERDEKLAQRDAKIAQLEERIAQLEGRSDGAALVPSAAPVAPAPGAVDVGAVPDSSKDVWL